MTIVGVNDNSRHYTNINPILKDGEAVYDTETTYLVVGDGKTRFRGLLSALIAGKKLSINKAVITSAAGLLDTSTTTSTEIGYVSGVTSNIQTQLNAKVTAGDISSSGLTMPTSRVLARSTAGTGAVEELTATQTKQLLGGTTVGNNFFTLTNPSAITFPQINADNTVSALDAATFRAAIGAGTGGGTVTSVSGTANRISSTGGATPVIDIDAAYVGQTSITTLGTIGTGTWHGNTIGLAYGGTNADLSATGGTSQVLKQTSAGGAVTVAQLSASDLSNSITGTAGSKVVLQTSPTISAPVISGVIPTYNSIATVNNGVGICVAKTNLTGQTAAIGATTLYTADADGFYSIFYNAAVTTAATSSSTLGAFQVKYTAVADSAAKTFPTSGVNFVNQTNANATTAAIGGCFTVYAKSGTNIQYVMAYASSGATAMAYSLNVIVVKL